MKVNPVRNILCAMPNTRRNTSISFEAGPKVRPLLSKASNAVKSRQEWQSFIKDEKNVQLFKEYLEKIQSSDYKTIEAAKKLVTERIPANIQEKFRQEAAQIMDSLNFDKSVVSMGKDVFRKIKEPFVALGSMIKVLFSHSPKG